MAGGKMEPLATTVAGEEPEMAANRAQATTAASPRPPYQCPTIELAKAIMRRATPPWVRKLPARINNAIAMISKLSMPVKSLSATASIGTEVITNRKLSTVRPSAIEIGIPVSIIAISRPKMRALFIGPDPLLLPGFRGRLRHGQGHDAAARLCARMTRRPVEIGSTSDKSRAAHRGR